MIYFKILSKLKSRCQILHHTRIRCPTVYSGSMGANHLPPHGHLIHQPGAQKPARVGFAGMKDEIGFQQKQEAPLIIIDSLW